MNTCQEKIKKKQGRKKGYKMEKWQRGLQNEIKMENKLIGFNRFLEKFSRYIEKNCLGKTFVMKNRKNQTGKEYILLDVTGKSRSSAEKIFLFKLKGTPIKTTFKIQQIFRGVCSELIIVKEREAMENVRTEIERSSLIDSSIIKPSENEKNEFVSGYSDSVEENMTFEKNNILSLEQVTDKELYEDQDEAFEM